MQLRPPLSHIFTSSALEPTSSSTAPQPHQLTADQVSSQIRTRIKSYDNSPRMHHPKGSLSVLLTRHSDLYDFLNNPDLLHVLLSLAVQKARDGRTLLG